MPHYPWISTKLLVGLILKLWLNQRHRKGFIALYYSYISPIHHLGPLFKRITDLVIFIPLRILAEHLTVYQDLFRHC